MVLAISIASGVASVVYIVLLRWLANVCVWATIFLVLGGLGFAIYQEYIYYVSSRYTEWLVVLVASSVLFCLIVLAILFLRKRISLACQFIKEASK